MQGKTVAVVVGDLGGAKEVIPIAKELERRGARCVYFLDSSPKAKAGDVLGKAGVSYETRGPNTEDKSDAILVGTSATANGAQVAWTEWGKKQGVPVLWMEDLHGTGSRANSRSVAPDVMLVIDKMAAEIAQKVRPNLTTIVVGKPTFSDPKEMPRLEDGPAIRSKVRGELGLTENDFLVVAGFGGDPAERAEAQLSEILKAMPLWIFKNKLVIAWRFHPKHPRAAGMYDEAVAACAASGIRTVDARKMDMNHLTIASDICVADWGNTNQLVALLHGTPLVTMMFSPDPRLVDVYPPDGVPPAVATSLNWGAMSVEDIERLFDEVLDGRDGARQYTCIVRGQDFMSLLQPGAAERAADIVMQAAQFVEKRPDLIRKMIAELPDRLNDSIVDEANSTTTKLQTEQGIAEPTLLPNELPRDSGGCSCCGGEHG